jgi:lipopolysaccharide exporter
LTGSEVDAREGDVRSTEDLTEATAAGLRWVAYARVGVETLLLASMVVLARLMPPSAFGIFAVVVIVQELALILPMEGVGSALVQRRSIGRQHLQAGLVLSLGVAVAFTGLTLVVAQILVHPVYGPQTAGLVMLATPCFLLGAVNAVPVAILRRRLDFARLGLIDFVSTLMRTVVTVGLAFYGLDAAALVLGQIASMATGLALSAYFAGGVPPPRWNRQAVRDLLPYSGPAALATVAWTGFRNGDYAIVGAQLGAAQAGLYWRGYQLAVEYQRKISIVMTQMAFPVLARTAGHDEMLALRRRMVQLLTVTLFPLLVLLVLLAPKVVPWLFGPAWEPAVLPAQILAAGGAATLVIDAVGSTLMAAGRSKAMLVYGVAHFVVYVGAVVLVARHGLVAVAIAAAVVHSLFLVVAYQVLLGGRGGRALRFLWDDVRAATVSCAVLFGGGGLVEWILRGAGAPAIVHMVLVGGAGGIAYLVALRVCFAGAWNDLLAASRRVVPARGVRVAARLARRPRLARAQL